MSQNALQTIRNITDFEPEIALVLGSGLGGLADKIETVAAVPYSSLPDIPVSTAPGHQGRFIFGYLEGKRIVAMQGRVHLYEGYTAQEVVLPIRLMRQLGAKRLILTNAAGGIGKELNLGDFMLIKDHISSFVPSPLIGKNDDSLGTRFPDMSHAYDESFCKAAKKAAKGLSLPLKEGVYVQLTGPQFETPAEIAMLAKLGADAVGMSTVIETIAAVHCGMKVGGISLITNLACGLLDQPITGEEVCEAADKASVQLEAFIRIIIRELPNEES